MKGPHVVLVTFALLLWTSFHAIGDTHLSLPTNTLSDYAINPYVGVPFEDYLIQKSLGTLRKGIWTIKPPASISGLSHVANLAYVLTLYENYASANQTNFDDLGIKELQYAQWSFKEHDLNRYFEAHHSLLIQTMILEKYFAECVVC